MAREIQVDMSRESVDLEDLSSRLAHKKVCNINLKRNGVSSGEGKTGSSRTKSAYRRSA